MKFIILPLILASAISGFAQITFKQGYVVDKEGNRSECFIEDRDWAVAPESINYRLTETGETLRIDTEKLSEFYVPGSRFIRVNVQYDKSSQALKDLTLLANPDWAQGELWLEVIVDGKAKLYQYISPISTLFFFNVDAEPIEQLVYKESLRPKEPDVISFNRMYLSQLNRKVRCGSNEPVNDRQVPYKIDPLMKHFRSFNTCSGGVLVDDGEPSPRRISIRLTPGIDYASVRFISSGGREQKWKPEASLRIGVDVQVALPFQHGKLAVVCEPNYFTFNGISDDTYQGTLMYSGIELPLGFRYRFFLTDKNYIFVNAMGLLAFSTNFSHENVVGTRNNYTEIDSSIYGYLFGTGVAVGRFSLEARYSWSKNVGIVGGDPQDYTQKKPVIILGFRVF